MSAVLTQELVKPSNHPEALCPSSSPDKLALAALPVVTEATDGSPVRLPLALQTKLQTPERHKDSPCWLFLAKQTGK